jgi:hypothetical protein
MYNIFGRKIFKVLNVIENILLKWMLEEWVGNVRTEYVWEKGLIKW